jgi:hypothetical protein
MTTFQCIIEYDQANKPVLSKKSDHGTVVLTLPQGLTREVEEPDHKKNTLRKIATV